MLQNELKNQNTNRLLGCIIFVGMFLRLYTYFELPYSHDEYSAISRTYYTNFSDLIQFGVLPDYHPAGIQIFLYYWVNIFGNDPWIARIPFVLCSLLSIYLVFKVTKLWSNETVGLIAAAFLASTQFTVMYGVFIRPYSVGLFFTLLLILALTHMILEPKKNFWSYWVLFVLSGIGCSYVQYVSMMVAGIIGVSAIIFIRRDLLKYYVLAGILIALAYIPHIEIFRYHMNKGGVGGPDGWLHPPTPAFFFDFIKYLFHHSLLSILLLISIFTIAYFTGKKVQFTQQVQAWKRWYIVAFWFLFPTLICYFYSVYKNPILQFSGLIFTHFLLYLLFFGHIKNLKPKTNALIVALILATNSFTLIYTRQHFEVSTNIGYNQIVDQIHTLRAKNPSIPALVSTDFRFTNYHLKKLNKHVHFDSLPSQELSIFVRYMDSISKLNDSFYFVQSFSDNPTTLPLAMRYFPHQIDSWTNQDNCIYLLSKTGKSAKRKMVLNWNSTSDRKKYWKNIDVQHTIQNDSQFHFKLDSTIEWGPQITLPIQNVVSTNYTIIDIEVDFENIDLQESLILTASVHEADSLIDWSGSVLSDQRTQHTQKRLFHSIIIHNKAFIKANHELRIQIWNNEKINCAITGFRIYTREGNPLRYAIFEDVDPKIISNLTNLQHQ